MVRNIFWGRYRFSIFIFPKDLEILFDIFCICEFQVICWSMVRPRQLKSTTFTKGSSFNSNFGIRLIIFRWWSWNIMYFVFLTFSDNLLKSRHFCISFRLLFIACERDTILSGVFCSSFSLMKMHLKMSSAKWRSFCPGGDELNHDMTYAGGYTHRKCWIGNC